VSASTSSSNPGARTKVGSIEIDRRFAWLTAALFALVFGLSSIPDLDDAFQGPVWSFLANAMHAPLFGAVGFCCYRTFSTSRVRPVVMLAVAFVASAAYAALDEWHQSFVAGRDATLSDFLVDIAGVAIALFLVAGGSLLRGARARAAARVARTDAKTPPHSQIETQ